MGIELRNSFVLDMPQQQAWALLTDIEKIAPCVPGVQLTAVEGEEYKGKVKIKLGPITAEYAGSATIKQQNDSAHQLLVEGKGRDIRGQGTAGVLVTMTVAPDGVGSKVDVMTDVQVTGKVASLGRSVMHDVARRLIDQFVTNLGKLAIEPAVQASGAARDTVAVAAPPEAQSTLPKTDAVAASVVADGPRLINSAEAKPVDLLAIGGSALFSKDVMVGLWRLAVLILLVLILMK
jgi:carbon monoxide dehydrogenase subunit G